MRVIVSEDGTWFGDTTPIIVIELPDDLYDEIDDVMSQIELMDWTRDLEETGEYFSIPVLRVKEGALNE